MNLSLTGVCGVVIALGTGCAASDPSVPSLIPAAGASSGSGGGTTGSSSGSGTTSSSSGSGGGATSSSGGGSASSSGGSGSGSGGASSGGSSSSASSGAGSGGSSSGASGSDGGTAAKDSGSGSTTVDAGESLEDLCVATINAYRATINQPPYTRWTAEESCTSTEAQKDSVSGTAHSAFGSCGEFGQCECPGWPGPLDQMIVGCLKAMWDEGPGGGHYDIMASSSYTKVACGFFTMTSGSIWAAQDYK